MLYSTIIHLTGGKYINSRYIECDKFGKLNMTLNQTDVIVYGKILHGLGELSMFSLNGSEIGKIKQQLLGSRCVVCSEFMDNDITKSIKIILEQDVSELDGIISLMILLKSLTKLFHFVLQIIQDINQFIRGNPIIFIINNFDFDLITLDNGIQNNIGKIFKIPYIVV